MLELIFSLGMVLTGIGFIAVSIKLNQLEKKVNG